MSVDRLRSQYCRPVIMTFKQARMEQKVLIAQRPLNKQILAFCSSSTARITHSRRISSVCSSFCCCACPCYSSAIGGESNYLRHGRGGICPPRSSILFGQNWLGGGYGNFLHVVKNFSEIPATFFFARRRRNFWELAGGATPPPPNGKNVSMSELPTSFLLCILGQTGLTMALMRSCSQLRRSHQECITKRRA